MLRLEYDKGQVEQTIDRIVKKTMDMELTWGWLWRSSPRF